MNPKGKEACFDLDGWLDFAGHFLAQDSDERLGRLPAELHSLLRERIGGPSEHWRKAGVSGWYYGQLIPRKKRIEQAQALLAGSGKAELGELLFQLSALLTRINPVIHASIELWLPLPLLEHPAAYRQAVRDLLVFMGQAACDLLEAAAAMPTALSDRHALAVLNHLHQACLLWAARGWVCRTGFPYQAVSRVACGHAYSIPLRALDQAKALHASIQLMPVGDADMRHLRDQLEIDATGLIPRLGGGERATTDQGEPKVARLAKFPAAELYRVFRDCAGAALAARGFTPLKKKPNQWTREMEGSHLYVLFQNDGRYGTWSGTKGGRFVLSVYLADAPPETLDLADAMHLPLFGTMTEGDFGQLNRIRGNVFAKIRSLEFTDKADRMLHEYALTTIESDAKTVLARDSTRALDYYDHEDVKDYLSVLLPRLEDLADRVAGGDIPA
jgi:hypothetical protein